MKLTTTRTHGRHKIGDTIDATPNIAAWLIHNGYAIPTQPQPTPTPNPENADTKPDKAKRTSRKTRNTKTKS